jgi:hypothetical protein
MYASERVIGSSEIDVEAEASAVEMEEQNSMTAGSGRCTEREN